MDDFVKMVETTLKGDRDRFFNFLSLVKRMREAQKKAERAHLECIDYSEVIIPIRKAEALEREVDEYLKKMEI